MTDPIHELWTSQERDARPLSPAELARRARMLHRRLARRDAIEYAAGSIAALAFVWIALTTPEWSIRAACALIVIGMGVVMWNLWKRRMPAPPEALGATGLDYFRAELVRQRDSLASVARWYLGPLVPGLTAFFLASGWVTARTAPVWLALVTTGTGLAIMGGLFWFIHRLNRAAADRLDQEIRALDAER